jgi:hypothetical protein
VSLSPSSSVSVAGGASGDGAVIMPCTTPADSNGSWANYYGAVVPLYYSGANGDWVEYLVSLAAGTWAVQVYGNVFNGAGIGTFSLDGTDIDQAPYLAASASFDQYNAAAQNLIQDVCSDLTIPADGSYTLRITCSGKNASSSGYQLSLYWFTLARVA